MKTIAYFTEAEDEITNALLASRDSVAFRGAIDDALQDIAGGTITHARIARSSCRRCDLTAYPYSIIYAETGDEIQVVAFQHHKRRANYWKSRLPKN